MDRIRRFGSVYRVQRLRVYVTQLGTMRIHNIHHFNVRCQSAHAKHIIKGRLLGGVFFGESLVLSGSICYIHVLPSPPQSIELSMMEEEYRVYSHIRRGYCEGQDIVPKGAVCKEKSPLILFGIAMCGPSSSPKLRES